MSTTIKWNPYRDMAQMHKLMNERLRNPLAFQTPESPVPGRYELAPNGGGRIALDVAEVEDTYIVKASVPGINPDDIEVTLDDNVLTIRAEVKQDAEFEKETYHLRERRTGSFARSIKLPVAINTDEIEAVNEYGILTISLPKAEVAKPKRIAIHTGGGMVEAEAAVEESAEAEVAAEVATEISEAV